MHRFARSPIVAVMVAVAVVVVVALFIATGDDGSVEIAGDDEPDASVNVPPSGPDVLTGSSRIDWAALLGTDDGADPGPATPSGRPSAAGEIDAASTTAAPDGTSVPPGLATTTTVLPGGTTSSTVASAGSTTSTTVAPGPGPSTTKPPSSTTLSPSSTTVPSGPTTTVAATTTVVAGTSTTSTSTTTAPTTTTTTTTTVAPTTTEAPLAPFTRRFDSSGGSITVSWNGSSLSLDSIDPARHYRPSVHEASATSIAVGFVAKREHSYISVRVVGNDLVVNVS